LHSGVERVGALLRSITIEVKLPPRGIVFDMDGVLLNSSPIHAAAYLEALAGLSITDFRYSSVAGMRSSDGMRAILKQNNIQLPDEQIAALAEAKSRIALTRIAVENPIVPGAIAVLGTLAGRVRLALASSGSEAAVNSFLQRNELRPLFQCVLHAGDVHRTKPSPEIFALAIERLGLNPEDSLVVEDAVAGIQAAKAAGAVACGIPSTCGAAELERAGADLIIDKLEDLLQIGAAA
jgi:HAD superfamily hydrolase (TIGR01509 family)